MAEKKTNAEMLKDLESKVDKLLEAQDGSKDSTGKKSTAAKSSGAKKPATKKPAAKSTAAKSTASTTKSTAKSAGTAKKAAPKSAAAKKLATPKEKPVEQEPVAEAPVDEPQQPAPEPVAASVEQEPVVTAPVDEPKAEPVEAPAPAAQEPVAEEPAPQPAAEEPAPEPQAEAAATEEPKEEPKAEPAPAPAPATQEPAPAPAKKGAAAKADNYINNKGKKPIFIIVNALFVLSAIMLLTMPFCITTDTGIKYYSLFSYFGKKAEVLGYWEVMAGGWAKGGYGMLGILMFFAFLIPLALAVKNIIFAVRKKNFNVYKADALIMFGFVLFYFAMVNLYGTNVTAGQVIAFIISAADLVFVILTLFLTKSVKSLPFFSLINIVLAMVAVFFLVGPALKDPNGTSIYMALAADVGNGLPFVMTLFAIGVLILLIIMQMKRLPKIVEIVVPLAAFVLVLIALIGLGASKPDGYKVAGNFIFGFILLLLLAAADTVFTFVKPLSKYKSSVHESENKEEVPFVAANEPTPAPAQAPATEAPASEAPATETPAAQEPAQAPAAQPKDDGKPKAFCPACGAENPANAGYCRNCGHRM